MSNNITILAAMGTNGVIGHKTIPCPWCSVPAAWRNGVCPDCSAGKGRSNNLRFYYSQFCGFWHDIQDVVGRRAVVHNMPNYYDRGFYSDRCFVTSAETLQGTITQVRNEGLQDPFIVGYPDLYEATWPLTDRLELVIFDEDRSGDLVFPFTMDAIEEEFWCKERRPTSLGHATLTTWLRRAKI